MVQRLAAQRLPAPLSAGWLAFLLYVGLMLLFTPAPFLVGPGRAPLAAAGRVVRAAYVRLFRRTALPHGTFLAVWATGTVLGPFVPLRYLTGPLRACSLLLWTAGIASLLAPGQREHTWRMLRTEPAMGYMWQDTVNIAFVSAVCCPASPRMLGGPAFALCGAPPLSARWRTSGALCFALLATLAVLPSIAPMIDDADGMLKFRGYDTPSVFGVCWSLQLVVCWIRVLHLISRACARAIVAPSASAATEAAPSGGRWRRRRRALFAAAWLPLGNVLVMNYVCTAWPLHFAFANALGIYELV